MSQIEVKIQTNDKQLISGYIPRYMISALNTIYQGIHLTYIELTVENIQFNSSHIFRGSSL
ncbi:LmeA family phospholipid-binding protein [Richelia intracellularis]|uniref:LmeA family phospholipid-binding protein n=1 Tax=Richelia intracellularis TaxID=1164990 RepID=UPI000EDFEEE1|nr:hypothetical protein [Richelia sp.]